MGASGDHGPPLPVSESPQAHTRQGQSELCHVSHGGAWPRQGRAAAGQAFLSRPRPGLSPLLLLQDPGLRPH